MNIDGINNGIVIDHIKAGNGFKIYNSLKLNELECSVAIITNAKSEKMGKKDIIKIDQDIDIDLNVLGYLDPDITINIVKNKKIIDKYNVQIPTELVNIIKCKTPSCITSTERALPHIFLLADKDKKMYRCKYCDTLEQESI